MPYLLLLESCILNHAYLPASAIAFSIRDSDTETIWREYGIRLLSSERYQFSSTHDVAVVLESEWMT